ncbi:hypothetical protein [Aeromonas media]|uniref:hypothetical protein n=1 Tax=Aeromonas media TaxID=651 RepID=UPI003D1F511F
MDYEKYKNNMAYPDRADFETICFGKLGSPVYKLPAKGFLDAIRAVPELSGESVIAGLDRCYSSKGIMDVLSAYRFMSELEFDKEAYDSATTAYNAHSSELHQQFEQDLLAECGLEDIPAHLVGPLLSLAYQDGHSAGFSEVANKFYSLAEATVPLMEFYRSNKTSIL